MEAAASAEYRRRDLQAKRAVALIAAKYQDYLKNHKQLLEGMTEYFTRAVQGKTTGTDKNFRTFCKEYSPRAGHYDAELKKVNLIDQHSLSRIGAERFRSKDGKFMMDVMEQAHFNGPSAGNRNPFKSKG